MYFAIYRYDFHPQYEDPNIFKHLKSVCQKLSKQFKVVAKPFSKNQAFSQVGILSIAISTVSDNQQFLESLSDKMAEACEKSELGRLYSSNFSIESFDVLDDERQDDTNWLE